MKLNLVDVVAGLHLLSGVVSVAVTAVVAVVVAGGDPVGWVLVALLAALSGLTLAIGWGLRRRRVWARTGAIALSVCWLLTGAGALLTLFTLWTLLFTDDGRKGFALAEPGDSTPSLD